MNSAVNCASVALTARRLIIRLLNLVLIVSTLSAIVPQSASAATVTATGSDASFCNQTVDVSTGVTAERLANGDCVVKFSTPSTNISWTVPTGVTAVNLLVVAGGGGGGSRHAGGGGGGGVLYVTNYSVTPSGTVALNVGAGGSGAAGGAAAGGGTNGDNSYFGGASGGTSILATGGGGGGGGATASGSGGSSGGTNHQDSASGSATPGSAGGVARTAGASTSLVINGVTATVNAYGTKGGVGLGSTCRGSDTLTGWCGGGGGGAGAVGSAPTFVSGTQYKAGNGGNGTSNSITGTSVTYGGGGGGGSGGDTSYGSTTLCANNSALAGNGGSGGGGAGGVCANSASPGTANTGGGGGAGGLYYVTGNSNTNGPAGAGGSGLVVISYTPSICSPASQTSGGYTILTFTSTTSCNWAVPAGVTAADVLVVGGGGGAGDNSGGGGSGGGVYYQTSVAISGTMAVTVGAGGAAGTSKGSGTNGGQSIFGSTTVTGGIGGVGYTGGTGGTAVAGSGSGSPGASGTGGRGSTGPGVAGISGSAGPSISITGVATNYAGGGGGGGWVATSAGGAGGSGGGGAGGGSSGTSGTAGSANTGGGGGSSSTATGTPTPTSGAGGSGIVIVRYANAPSITLSSNAISAVIGSLSSYSITQGGGPVTSYAIPSADSIALTSVGISFSTSTGLISGSPSGTLASRSITITATNSTGTSTATFSIVVNNPACSPASQVTGGYTILTFTNTSTCNWSVPAGVTAADVLVVGGGGAGGTASNGAGGGGGGGQVNAQASTSFSGAVTIQIGSGGTPNPTVGTSTAGGNGGTTSFTPTTGSAISATGGSGGASVTPSTGAGTASSTGFNGGGGSAWANSYSNGTNGVGGYKGGNAWPDGSIADPQAGGGGGGSGAAGANATSGAGGTGGVGVSNSYTGSAVFYGGGGGGGKRTTSGTSGSGGNGGGGAGGKVGVGSTATANTGGGGGGGGGEAIGGAGAAGVVIIRYAMPAVSITTPTNGLTGSLGSAYSLSLLTSGGSGTGTFSIASGSLPAGVTLNNSSGVISGTPTATGTFAITARITDTNTTVATTSSFSIVINPNNVTATFNSNYGTPTTSTQAIPYSTATALTSNAFTRTGYTFAGWTANADGTGTSYTDGQSVTITTATTYYAKWTQNSLAGLTGLEYIGQTVASDARASEFSTRNGASSVTAIVQQASLDPGTIVNFHLVNDFARAKRLLGAGKEVILSLVVSWITPAGITPDIEASRAPISVTLRNELIKKGASTYVIINGVATPLGTATTDGEITVSLRVDPEVVIVTTKPDAPTGVTATSNGNAQSVISWSAPASDGGSAITGYTVTSSPSVAAPDGCKNTTNLSCTFTGLTNGTAYTFTVTATNEIGTSDASTAAYGAPGSVSTTFTLSGATITTSAFEGRSVVAVISNIPSGGTYTYQWFGGSDVNSLTELTSASALLSSYTPKASDRSYANQMYLSVRVVATISTRTYTFNSPAIPVYTYPNATGGSVTAPSPAARGTYTPGKYKVGGTVIGHSWNVMGTPWPTLNYQWWICNTAAATASPAAPGCAAATDAGNSGAATRGGYASSPTSIQSTNLNDLGNYGFSYVVPEAAAGKFLTFTATLSNEATTAQGGGAVFTFTQSRTQNSGIIQTTPDTTGYPNISGINSVGQRLTAQAVSATKVNSNPTGTISYRWQRCTGTAAGAGTGCSNISGATSTTYTPTNADLGTYLQIIARATNAAGDYVEKLSPQQPFINPAYSIPSGMSVSLGTPSSILGTLLTAQLTNATTGYPSPITYEYQWQRTNNLGAFGNIGIALNVSSYRLGNADVGRRVRVGVRATNSVGTSAWVYSSNLGPIYR